MNKKQKKNLQRIIAAVVLVLILKLLPQFPTPVELVLYCIPYLVVGWDVLRKALLGIKNRQPFDECFLMAVATVGAFALGDYVEGCAVISSTRSANCSRAWPWARAARAFPA